MLTHVPHAKKARRSEATDLQGSARTGGYSARDLALALGIARVFAFRDSGLVLGDGLSIAERSFNLDPLPNWSQLGLIKALHSTSTAR